MTFPLVPTLSTFCKGVIKVNGGNEFALLIHYRRRHYSRPEVGLTHDNG
jgi:hypothetical protein